MILTNVTHTCNKQWFSPLQWVATSKHALTSHRVACSQSLMSLTACEEYKPLGISLNFSCQRYPKLARETAATEQQRPASQLQILQYWSYLHARGLLLCMRNCQSMHDFNKKQTSYYTPCLCNTRFKSTTPSGLRRPSGSVLVIRYCIHRGVITYTRYPQDRWPPQSIY